MQWGPPVVLKPSLTTTSIIQTPSSIFRTLALFFVAKFLYLELRLPSLFRVWSESAATR